MNIPLILTLLISGMMNPDVDGYSRRAEHMYQEGIPLGTLNQIEMQKIPKLPETIDTEQTVEWLNLRALFERDSELLPARLESFISQWPASPYREQAKMLLGDVYFFRGEYASAAEAYSEVSPQCISGEENTLLTYRYGVSLLKCGMFRQGEAEMNKLPRAGKYGLAARFYKGWVAYAEGNYDVAERELSAVADCLPNDMQGYFARRGEYIPSGLEAAYFLTQIEFIKGDYNSVIAHGRSIIERMPIREYIPELRRIIGESYFLLGEKRNAESWLEDYIAEVGDAALHTAVYYYGVLLYDGGQYSKAAQLLERISSEQDAIGQGASLYLGLCQLKTGHDHQAVASFKTAAERSYDYSVAETAYYNYLAAMSRGGGVPFASLSAEMEAFLRAWPSSSYASEVEQYLATAYYNDKDYEKALQSISNIPHPSKETLAVRQKILYQLGIRRLNNGDAQGAETCFTEAAGIRDCDASIAMQSLLWLGDAQYQLGKYTQAAASYSRYLQTERSTSNATLAHYNLGYSYYNEHKWEQAARQFQTAIEAREALPKPLKDDAVIRYADCLNYSGKYADAKREYTRAMDMGAMESDYARYRRALIEGREGNIRAKLNDLEAVVRDYPQSRWHATAMLEKALTYQEGEMFDDARKAYEALSATYPQASETRTGMLQLASGYIMRSRGEEAEPILREIISRWPTSEEASLANADLRRLHAEEGTLSEYIEFLRSVPGAPAPNDDEIERAMFESAEIGYGRNGSIEALLNYVAAYPNGRYLAAALLDIAENQISKGAVREAEASLTNLLRSRPDSPQAPMGLLMRAELYEEQGRRESALADWRALASAGDTEFLSRARRGIMRTTPTSTERLTYATLLESQSKTPEELEEAKYYKALAEYDTGNISASEALLKEMSAADFDTRYRAMAALALANVYKNSGNYEEETAVLEHFTDKGTPHNDLLAQGFLALAENYHRAGRSSLALQYLKWLDENYPGSDDDGIRGKIRTLMSEIKESR